MKRQPILIAAPPRSGTTMVAGLLGKHGVWIGNGRTTRYPGTNPPFVSENQDIKRIMKREGLMVGYVNWSSNLPAYLEYPCKVPCEEIKREVDRLVPDDVNWLVKTSWTLVLSAFWQAAYPEAKWMFLKRDKKDILASMNRHPGMAKKEGAVKIRFIEALHDRQDVLRGMVNNSIELDADKIAMNDKDEIKRLFAFARIPPDFDIINNWINPRIWSK